MHEVYASRADVLSQFFSARLLHRRNSVTSSIQLIIGPSITLHKHLNSRFINRICTICPLHTSSVCLIKLHFESGKEKCHYYIYFFIRKAEDSFSKLIDSIILEERSDLLHTKTASRTFAKWSKILF